MNRDTPEEPDDLVEFILQCAAAAVPELNAELQEKIADQVKKRVGGRRYFIGKTSKNKRLELRRQVYQDGLTNLETDEIVKRRGISRATLYRVMKRGVDPSKT